MVVLNIFRAARVSIHRDVMIKSESRVATARYKTCPVVQRANAEACSFQFFLKKMYKWNLMLSTEHLECSRTAKSI